MDSGSVPHNCSKSEQLNVKPSPGFAPPVKSELLPAGKKLTKDLVLSKSKGGNLVEIKKIVVWGQKITDCSIVTEIPELEVASMNANKISSLEHFGQCPNLRELFLRSNCIEDIGEIFHLKDLPNLQVLWLAGNPCTKHPKYRSTVVRNLEQLLKLDDTEISPAERASCEADGLLLEEPQVRAPSVIPMDLEERMRPADDVGKKAAADAAAPADADTAGPKQPAAETAEPPQMPPAPSQPPNCPEAAAPPPPLPTQDAADAVKGNDEAALNIADESTSSSSIGVSRPGTAAAAAAAPAGTLTATSSAAAASPPLPRYALAEVRTAVLRLIRLLDHESLQLVQLTVRSRLEKEATTSQQPQQPPASGEAPGPDMSAQFSLDNL